MMVVPFVSNFKGVKNQFIIGSEEYIIFQSYSTIIVLINKKHKIIVVNEEYYSPTTSKYLNLFQEQYAYIFNDKTFDLRYASEEYIIKHFLHFKLK